MITHYSSPYNLGHKALNDFWDGGDIIVQEKIDGSQFSFGVINGGLFARSRGQRIDLDNPDNLFQEAIDTILAKYPTGCFPDGYVFRGEYLKKPKHNTLKYSRVPENHVILFDIDIGDQDYLPPEDVQDIANDLNFEYVPTWRIYKRPHGEDINTWLEEISILGGVKREGIVFKNYRLFDRGKKVLMAKYVNPEFREQHQKSWPKSGSEFIIDEIVNYYKTDARWKKAIQHLHESGELQQAPQDIPNLMREVSEDIYAECEDEIKEFLFKHFWKQISKGVTRGLPEWYKEYLAKEQMEEECKDEMSTM